jgi:hypothetical protein
MSEQRLDASTQESPITNPPGGAPPLTSEGTPLETALRLLLQDTPPSHLADALFNVLGHSGAWQVRWTMEQRLLNVEIMGFAASEIREYVEEDHQEMLTCDDEKIYQAIYKVADRDWSDVRSNARHMILHILRGDGDLIESPIETPEPTPESNNG